MDSRGGWEAESLVPLLPTSLVFQKTEIQICVSSLGVKTWQPIIKNQYVGPTDIHLCAEVSGGERLSNIPTFKVSEALLCARHLLCVSDTVV